MRGRPWETQKRTFELGGRRTFLLWYYTRYAHNVYYVKLCRFYSIQLLNIATIPDEHPATPCCPPPAKKLPGLASHDLPVSTPGDLTAEQGQFLAHACAFIATNPTQYELHKLLTLAAMLLPGSGPDACEARSHGWKSPHGSRLLQ